MVTSTQQQVKESSVIVEQELKRINAQQLYSVIMSASATLGALGIIEMLFGLGSIIAPSFAGAFFVLLMGGALTAGGALEFVSGVIHKSLARVVHGVASAVVGLLAIAHPLYGLTFLTGLIGVYLLISGIDRFFEPRRTSWAMSVGVLNVIFAIIVFAALPVASNVLLGWMIGLNLISGGFISTRIAASLRSGLR
ncbi:MAG: hypothetical protein A2293_01375 [Elusimicrobia bacterium RIFOXYB2_FULL_49_7]|nr:MAG: hypothetical protein A2293_01375 [Elusimicrobia bacterium RIFOXYB2_FULL_49_7]